MEGPGHGTSGAQPSTPARAAVDIVAITTRDEFLLELGQALGGQASITPVESVTQALEQLGPSKRLRILVMDCQSLSDVCADVDTIKAQAPQVAVLVFAQSEQEQDVAAMLKGSNVFAVLPVPVDPRKTVAVFSGAVAESKARQAPPKPVVDVAPVVRTAAPVAEEPIRPEPPDSGGPRVNARMAAGVAVALLAAAALWLLTRHGQPPQSVANRQAVPDNAQSPAADASAAAQVAAPAIETSLVKGEVDDLLEKARSAMRERRYAEPAGDNALLYYRSAAAADAASGEALDGLARVGAVLATRFDEAMAADHDDEAAVVLAQLRIAVAGNARLAELQSRLTSAQISKALAVENPERAAALVRAAQQSDAISAAQLTKWRTDIARVQDEVKQKRLTAQQAARDAAAAEQKQAREARAAAAETERKAQVAKEKENEERLKAEQIAKAADDAASAARKSAAAGTAAALQSSLKRKRYVEAEYPQQARNKKIGGVVTVAFSVDVKGEVRDVRVLSAEPAGVFEQAAVAAVKRWRYEPPMINGAPTEVPVRMAIRFAAPQ